MWWLVDNFKHHPDFEGAYSATGYGGQFITIIPKLNMVIAHKTKLRLFYYLGLKHDVADWQYWELLHDYIGTKKE
jgi:CubicO group peptidase (beta-lactamase class C family)